MNIVQIRAFIHAFVTNRQIAMAMANKPKMLGDGHFSTVFDLGNGRVLKVANLNDDPGYEWFVSKIKNIRDNPFLPRVFFSGMWNGKRVYILEKLEPIWQREKTAPGAYDCYRNVRDAINEGGNPYLTVTDVHLLQVIEVLRSSKYSLDLHDENVMMRGDQPVITDPVSFIKR